MSRGILSCGGALMVAGGLLQALAAAPELTIEQLADGRIRTSGQLPGTNGYALERSSDPFEAGTWSLAPVGFGVPFFPGGSASFFRLRQLPPVERPAELEARVSLEPAVDVLRPRESRQFRVTSPEVVGNAEWLVNGLVGGSAHLGSITTQGVYTAPAEQPPASVEVTARVVGPNGLFLEAKATVWIPANPGLPGAVLIGAGEGGKVRSEDGEAIVSIPAGATRKGGMFSVANLLPMVEEQEADAFETAGMFQVETDAPELLTPVRVEFPLRRFFTPGLVLPLSVQGADGSWTEEATATVLEDGFRATAELPHFSIWAIRLPQLPPVLSRALPVVTNLQPETIREGELKPMWVRGTGLDGVRRILIRDAAGNPTGWVAVRNFAVAPGSSNELGVLIKSFPNPGFPAGSNVTYRLRWILADGRFSETPFTVSGLDEFELGNGRSFTVPAIPLTNRATFSRVIMSPTATLVNLSRALAWQATDQAQLWGDIISTGPRGVDAVGRVPGRMPEPRRTETGSGNGAAADPTRQFDVSGSPGNPALVVNMNEYRPAYLNHIYGQPGDSGFELGRLFGDGAVTPLAAASEGMYALYESELVDTIGSRDAFDFDFWHELADELTARHPEGRKGHQGRPGGHRDFARSPSAFYPRVRIIESGGGGGGGGASHRAWTASLAGLAGGSGGGGGGAVSLAAGNAITINDTASFDTSGGDGGHGAAPAPAAFSDPGPIGRGGGGGPGGAGSLHLLAGEQLNLATNTPLPRHTAGEWGQGGFLMTLQSHFQANPRSWLAPIADLPALSQGEIVGPDFTAAGIGIRTSVRVARLVEARALNPFFQSTGVRVIHLSGTRTFGVRGLTPRARTIRLALKPGLNRLVTADLPDHDVLNRDIVVLNSPDTDGDGIPDAEELQLGTNPNSPDTNSDGKTDLEDWLDGNQSAPGDSDGDGFPDAVETASCSDPNNPTSTPLNAVGCPGGRRATIIAQPAGIQVVRPTLRPAPTFVAAVPQSVSVVRALFQNGATFPGRFAVSTPLNVSVTRLEPGLLIGRDRGSILTTPRSLSVVRSGP